MKTVIKYGQLLGQQLLHVWVKPLSKPDLGGFTFPRLRQIYSDTHKPPIELQSATGMRTEKKDKCIFIGEEIIQNSCGPTGINLNLAQNNSESYPKFSLPASCDVYNFDLF